MVPFYPSQPSPAVWTTKAQSLWSRDEFSVVTPKFWPIKFWAHENGCCFLQLHFLVFIYAALILKTESNRNSWVSNYNTHKNALVAHIWLVELILTLIVFSQKGSVFICMCCGGVHMCIGWKGVKLDCTGNQDFYFHAPCRKCHSFVPNHSISFPSLKPSLLP